MSGGCMIIIGFLLYEGWQINGKSKMLLDHLQLQNIILTLPLHQLLMLIYMFQLYFHSYLWNEKGGNIRSLDLVCQHWAA